MLNKVVQEKVNFLHKQGLVFDIETSAFYANGKPIPIHDFENYVNHAQVKWIGFYSYRDDKSYCLNAKDDAFLIQQLFDSHQVLIGFNSEDFDIPILKNNCMLPDKKYIHIDVMTILGHSKFTTKSGYPYKNRGELMGYKFKKSSLRCMAKTMKLEVQKGDIDYKIFEKDEWTPAETNEIIKYTIGDILSTKGLFDKLWDFWLPFAEFVEEKYIYDLSWIKNSVASLTYKSACNVLGVEPSYSEKKGKAEDMGGRVILPTQEEARDVWYVDFASLYPHIMTMFNLFDEVDEDYPGAWHGNKIFNVKGYYDISAWNPLCRNVSERLKERIELKSTDKDNPKIYALKIWLNALYGAGRSSVFEQIHTKNFGWDVCWLGQQIQILTEDMMNYFGFDTIAGDTDSIFVKARDEKDNNREYVKECLVTIIEVIKDNVPFPVDTFNIDIEHYLEYVMWPFADEPIVEEKIRQQLKNKMIEGYREEMIEGEKKKCIVETLTGTIVKKGRSWVKARRAKKKNYVYLYKEKNELKIKIMGLPIKKIGATILGMKIYEEVLKEQILKNKRAKFSEEYINSLLSDYLKQPDIIKSLAREFSIKPADTYKSQSSIYAQISVGYLKGEAGVISLIKNNKIGKAGKGAKYCTLKEALKANLTVDDLDLDKVNQELSPFIEYKKEA